MCGIAGTYQRNGTAIATSVVTEMGLSISHRGPDNFGTCEMHKVAMTHNRLSLLDLSAAANQPFRNERYLLSYNGEIYNYQEIRNRLEREHNIEFKTTSDTEVLFYSLIHDGVEKCLQQIRGMFAFAFYDDREDRLFLARDRMGIKPLYYYQKEGNIYWASEIKALAKSLDLRPDPIRTLFAVNNMAEKSMEYSLFKGIRSVKPGCYLEIGPESEPRNHVYYDVLDDLDPDYYKELAALPSEQVLSTFENIFTKSVDSMLMSDVPVGAFVSGGIDSSFIASVAARSKDVKLFTANIVGKYSEFSDVQLLSKYLKKQVFEYRFEPHMMLRDWVDVTYFHDSPIVIHVNSIPFSGVARLAHDSDVKAVLTGEGADELFFGYPHLLTRRYESIASFPLKAIKSLYMLSPRLYKFLFPDQSQGPLPFLNELVQGFEVPQLRGRAEEKLGFLNNGHKVEQYLSIKMIREHLVALLHRNDRMGMMSSIEARFPYLDEEVIKFAINLPSKFKIGRSGRFHNYKHPFLIDKWIIRKTAENYLPNELVYKKKNGFPMFGHKFIKVKDGFFEKGWIEDSLGLRKDVQQYLLRSQDPYFIAKLASVEIFGRIFDLGQPLDTIKNHLIDHAEVLPN